jgi:hypothetical protein
MIHNLPSSMPILLSYNLFNYQFIPFRDCVMSQPVTGILPQRPRFNSRSVYDGFVVEKEHWDRLISEY